MVAVRLDCDGRLNGWKVGSDVKLVPPASKALGAYRPLYPSMLCLWPFGLTKGVIAKVFKGAKRSMKGLHR